MCHDFLKWVNIISRCQNGQEKDKKFEDKKGAFLRIQIFQIWTLVSGCVLLDVAEDGDALNVKCEEFKKL
jgi:acetamidase/formamidase